MKTLTLDTGIRFFTFAYESRNGSIEFGASCCHYKNGETGETFDDVNPRVGELIARYRLKTDPVTAISSLNFSSLLISGMLESNYNMEARLIKKFKECCDIRKTDYFKTAKVPDSAVNLMMSLDRENSSEDYSFWAETESEAYIRDKDEQLLYDCEYEEAWLRNQNDDTFDDSWYW